MSHTEISVLARVFVCLFNLVSCGMVEACSHAVFYHLCDYLDIIVPIMAVVYLCEMVVGEKLCNVYFRY